MATSRGKASVDAFFAQTPAKLTNMLRGAAKAGAAVVADEIKVLTPSEEVRENLRTRSKVEGETIRVRIDVKEGWARSVGIWLEYGTSPHFITVNDSARAGRSVGRINRLAKEDGSSHSLVIGGSFVGDQVFHPGSRPHPAFRPALDMKEGAAVAAAQAYINKRVVRAGIVGSSESEGGDE